ncbi:hypothetical protein [Halogranum rubrum]|uniref:hypothetical protein n=1 Tax=Halogranum rubrum TaxID=553466 RepID=UPI0012FC6ED6|nr:hypothetical protein [Halogranum salarium]
MAENSHSLLPRRSSLVSFVPVVLLILLVSFFMNTSYYPNLGYQLIFGSFAVGVISVLLSPIPYILRENSNLSTSLFFLGSSLTAGAVLLYPVFGCVFGCPG